MTPTDFYQRIILTTPEDLPDKVFRVLTRHVGIDNRITKDALSRELFGKYTESTDRQLREMFEVLKNEHIPVCSNSKVKGVWLAANRQERDECFAELQGRINNMQKAANGLRDAKVPPDHTYPPERRAPEPEPVQGALFPLPPVSRYA